MKLDDGLRGVARLGLDSSPVIYFIEANAKYDALVVEVFNRIIAGRIEGITSVVTLGEVLVQPLARGDARLQQRYRDVLLHSAGFDTRLIDAPAAERAAELRAQYGMRLPDALQLSVALDSGCQAFLTNDRRLTRVTELRVLALDELEL